MIKSRFSFIGIFLIWYLSLAGILVLYLTIGVIAHFLGTDIVNTNLTGDQYLIVLITFPILLLVALAQVKINAKVLYIDSMSRTVTFKNYFTGHKVVYGFDEIDGYIDTFVKSPRGDFRVFYLVKDNKLTNKISGRIYSNIEEIEEGLKPLKYLGFHKFNFTWTLKIFLNKQLLD